MAGEDDEEVQRAFEVGEGGWGRGLARRSAAGGAEPVAEDGDRAGRHRATSLGREPPSLAQDLQPFGRDAASERHGEGARGAGGDGVMRDRALVPEWDVARLEEVVGEEAAEAGGVALALGVARGDAIGGGGAGEAAGVIVEVVGEPLAEVEEGRGAGHGAGRRAEEFERDLAGGVGIEVLAEGEAGGDGDELGERAHRVVRATREADLRADERGGAGLRVGGVAGAPDAERDEGEGPDVLREDAHDLGGIAERRHVEDEAAGVVARHGRPTSSRGGPVGRKGPERGRHRDSPCAREGVSRTLRGARRRASLVMCRILGYCFGRSLDPVVRTSAILRRLVGWGEGIEAHLITNQSLADRHPLAGFDHYLCPPDGKAIVAKLRELRARVDPTLVVVDRYLLGIDGELPDVLGEFDCARVLIAGRTELKPRRGAAEDAAVVGAAPRRANLDAMARQLYDFCLAPADVLPFREHGRTRQVEPIVSCEPREFLQQVDARRHLRHSGKPIFLFYEEAGLRLYESLRRSCTTSRGLRIDWRLATQDRTLDARFPGECLHDLSLQHVMGGVACVIAPPLYSVYHEAVSSGAPALFIGLSEEMASMGRRAGPLFVGDPKVLARRILDGDLPEPGSPRCFGGAMEAARELRECLGVRPRHGEVLARSAGPGGAESGAGSAVAG